MESRIVFYSAEEIYEEASKLPMLKDYPFPKDEFILNHGAASAISLVDQGEDLTLAYFVCTVQGESNDLIEEMWLDGGIEATVLAVERELMREAEMLGRNLSLQKAPGRDDMPLAMGKVIYEITEAYRIGVEVTEEGLLKPQFSRSGVYAIGNGEATDHKGCGGCSGCKGNSGGCGMCAQFVYKDRSL